MPFTVRAHTPLHRLALAASLATLGAPAMAQVAPATPAAPWAQSAHYERGEGRMGAHDPAKMQAMMAKHQADLKTSLSITPVQEGAWASYTAAMQPPVNM